MWCTAELVRSLCARREVLCSNLIHRKRGLPSISFIFSPGDGPLVPVMCPGLKIPTFSPGLLVPVGKPGVELVPNRECQEVRKSEEDILTDNAGLGLEWDERALSLAILLVRYLNLMFDTKFIAINFMMMHDPKE